ncbi:MAG: endonuclease/exonuclease/phosphatase family protein [Salinirussus sp.]
MTMARLSVQSYNLRHAVLDSGVDAWPNRREAVRSVLRSTAPDLLGVQECTGDQHDDVAADLPAYDWIGVADQPGSGEHNPIGYTDRFRLRSTESEWLSETPATPGSVGWDGSFARVLTRATLVDTATGTTLTTFNAHFDHEGPEARRESARTIRQRIDELPAGRPAIVTGDFNCGPGSDPYGVLTGDAFDRRLSDARDRADDTTGPDSTLTDFERVEPDRRIDHVFVTGDVDVHSHRVVTDRGDRDRDRFPSDHLPVLVVLEVGG